jgi:hypothetical protein
MTRRLLVPFAALTAAAVLAAAWAIAAGGAAGTASASTADATWTPGGRLPGTPIGLTRPSARVQAGVQAAVTISRHNVDARTVREVIAGGVFGFGMRLITARDGTGAPCTSIVTDSGGARSFNCFAPGANAGPLVRYVADGGTTIGKVEWMSLVGLARSDVARVTLVAQSGSEQALSLNRWRGFAYATDSSSGFPNSLRAYDSGGSLIQEVPTLP